MSGQITASFGETGLACCSRSSVTHTPNTLRAREKPASLSLCFKLAGVPPAQDHGSSYAVSAGALECGRTER